MLDLNDIHAKVILADFVQVSDGKLTAVGSNWNWMRIATPAVTFGVGVMIDWPPAEVGSHHKITVDLVDEDGHVFELVAPDGAVTPLHFSQDVPVVSAPGADGGARVTQSLAMMYGGVPLQPGTRYEVRLEIDDEADADWFAAFSTRS